MIATGPNTAAAGFAATGFAMVSTTSPTAADAKTLGRALVQERIAACVQIVPIDSVYCWNGRVEEAREWLLICKIRADDFDAAEAVIRKRHSYKTPEIVMTPISRGSDAYLAWISASTNR